MKRIVIDLTPLLPGGDNGGAKPLAIELIRHLARVASTCEFILLTNEKSHDELKLLDAPNVQRLCTAQPENAASLSLRMSLRVRRLLLRFLPDSALQKLASLYSALFPVAPPRTSLLRQVEADLLFCPFTGVLFFDPSVPVVSLVHDLQYLCYPEFFEPEVRQERDRHFRQVCRLAGRLICVSEFTRAAVLEQAAVPPERVIAIPSSPQHRLAVPTPAALTSVPARLALTPGRYLLYPANFWRHKNHELLLTAFGIYRAAHPVSDLKLVLTGAPGDRRDQLIAAALRMGFSESVVFPGYLPDDEFAALLASCAAMIFPSLFEGFGMPVLEAMAAGVPVLCANRTGLPEVAGDAALLFDPRRPAEIVDAITRLETDPQLRRTLAEKGRQHVRSLSGPAHMAARYLQVFQDLVSHPAETQPAVYGVFPDGWTGGRMTVVFGAGAASRRLTVRLKAPEWLPSEEVSIRVLPGAEVHCIPRGSEKAFTRELPGGASGTIEFCCSPTFQPSQCGIGEDHRSLGCLLESATICGPNGDAQQLPTHADAA